MKVLAKSHNTQWGVGCFLLNVTLGLGFNRHERRVPIIVVEDLKGVWTETYYSTLEFNKDWEIIEEAHE